MRLLACSLLILFSLISCQQRYWHVKKVKVGQKILEKKEDCRDKIKQDSGVITEFISETFCLVYSDSVRRNTFDSAQTKKINASDFSDRPKQVERRKYLNPHHPKIPENGAEKLQFPVLTFFLLLLAVPIIILLLTNTKRRPREKKYVFKFKIPYDNPGQDKKAIVIIILFSLSLALLLSTPLLILGYMIGAYFIGIGIGLLIILGSIALMSLIFFYVGRKLAQKRLNEQLDRDYYRKKFFLVLLIYFLVLVCTLPAGLMGMLLVLFVFTCCAIWLMIDSHKIRKLRISN